MTLQQYIQSGGDEYLKTMTTQMWIKFQKYWSDFHPTLAIACVLDPRYKLQFVDYSYRKLHGNDSLEFMQVKRKMFSIFEEYCEISKKYSPPPLADKSSRKDNDQREPIDEIFKVCEI